MSKLLPPNSTALEQRLAAVGATTADLPVIIRDLWSPEACPLELLPWLAWAWSADEWSDTWSERQKRDVVKGAIAVQRRKGTIGAVRESLAALGLSIRVQEWFNQTPQAAPYTFNVYVETSQASVTQPDMLRALAVIERTKNLRSHLASVLVSASSRCAPSVAVVAHIGHDITLANYVAPVLVLSETTLPLHGTA